MRLRIVYHVKSISEYLSMYKNKVGVRSYKYVIMLVHAMILSERTA